MYSRKEIKTLHLRLNTYDLTSNFWIYSSFPLNFHPTPLERYASGLQSFVTMPLWQSSSFSIMFCHHVSMMFLVHCLSSTCWKLLSFSESIQFFFFHDFKIIEYLINLFNSNAATSRVPFIIFISLMVSNS